MSKMQASLAVLLLPSTIVAQEGQVRISVKHIVSPNRSQGVLETDVAIEETVTNANFLLENTGVDWRLQLVEIQDVGPSPETDTFFSLDNNAELRQLEHNAVDDARQNTNRYKWNPNAMPCCMINVN